VAARMNEHLTNWKSRLRGSCSGRCLVRCGSNSPCVIEKTAEDATYAMSRVGGQARPAKAGRSAAAGLRSRLYEIEPIREAVRYIRCPCCEKARGAGLTYVNVSGSRFAPGCSNPEGGQSSAKGIVCELHILPTIPGCRPCRTASVDAIFRQARLIA